MERNCIWSVSFDYKSKDFRLFDELGLNMMFTMWVERFTWTNVLWIYLSTVKPVSLSSQNFYFLRQNGQTDRYFQFNGSNCWFCMQFWGVWEINRESKILVGCDKTGKLTDITVLRLVKPCEKTYVMSVPHPGPKESYTCPLQTYCTVTVDNFGLWFLSFFVPYARPRRPFPLLTFSICDNFASFSSGSNSGRDRRFFCLAVFLNFIFTEFS